MMSGAKKIYDCFIFFNELDLLELRLEEHFDRVDIFVLCEANTTFTGRPKPLVFLENWGRFEKYASKIRHLVVDDMPQDGDAWRREFHQRSALGRALKDAGPDDIIIVSDCDEILSPAAFEAMRNNSGYFMFDLPMYQFYVNMMAVPSGWRKPFAYSYRLHERVPDYNRVRQVPEEVFKLFEGTNHLVSAGGWHFTFLGGADKVTEKLRAYSHAEAWQQSMLRSDNLKKQMVLLKDVGGGRFLTYCEIDLYFPETLRERYQHFVDIGFIKEPTGRIGDLEPLVARYDGDQQKLEARI